MAHAEEILALLDAQRCSDCGRPAVRGATMCLACAASVSDNPAARTRKTKMAKRTPSGNLASRASAV